jgi:hypothetical protein
MVPELRLVPVYLAERAARLAEPGAHPPDGLFGHGVETLHALVSDRLGADPALDQLDREAAAGATSGRTRRRVGDAVEQAAEDDEVFAARLHRILDDLARVRTPPRSSAGPTVRFDPFTVIPAFPLRLREARSRWLLLPGAVIGLLLVVATTLEGTLGTRDDVHLVRDVRYVFSGTVPYTKPTFPLVRDVTSIFLFLVVAVGVVLMHKQWQYIAAALPAMRRSGVITPRRQPLSNTLSRLLRLDALLGDCPDYQALDRLEQRMGSIRTRTKALLSGGVLVIGFVMATLAGNGISRVNHEVLAPTGGTAAQRQQWLEQARASWWAGPDHPMGLVLFALVTWFAMALILTCQTVGAVAVYMAAALYCVADLGVDWYNHDGRFGWMPVARIARTVYLCLILLGAGISFVVAVLGSQIVFSLVGLVMLYLLFIPVFTVVPWSIFNRVERQARSRRVAELAHAGTRIQADDLARVRSLVEEFARCRAARINPMRLRAVPSGVFVSVVLLPIVLTALQIYAQVGLGRRGT